MNAPRITRVTPSARRPSAWTTVTSFSAYAAGAGGSVYWAPARSGQARSIASARAASPGVVRNRERSIIRQDPRKNGQERVKVSFDNDWPIAGGRQGSPRRAREGPGRPGARGRGISARAGGIGARVSGRGPASLARRGGRAT